MILMVDNYDSFTYNLVQELAEIGAGDIRVVRNDAATVAELLALRPEAVVISPGPGAPESAGVSLELIAAAAAVPLLGVCLGHQALAAVHGGRVVRAPEPVHGKVSPIRHRGEGLFVGLPDPFPATRYHSLVVERSSLPGDLEVTAWTDDGLVMGLAHRARPHWGVQFHPESYLTRHGMRLLARFLELAGVAPGSAPAAGGVTT
jgi:anthranilate synthase/aminodeoxychorismate synthase-like glutamine amidotransferase